MPRNRIIYNLQDVFFGLPSGVYDNLDETQAIVNNGQNVLVSSSPLHQDAHTGDYQVLRRIDRVQSIDYTFNFPREEINVLGRSTSVERPILAPPDINLNFSYLVRGIQNESRMGLNVAAQGSDQIPLFVKDFLDSSRLKDRRNIYLLINNKNEFDIRNYESVHDLESGFIFSKSYLSLFETENFGQDFANSLSGASFLIENTESKNFGMLVFQNAYMKSMTLEASVGNLAKVDVSYVADNVIYKQNANRDLIPCLDTSNASISLDNNYYIVPKHWKEQEQDLYWNATFGPGDIEVEIIKDENPHKSKTIINYDFEDPSQNPIHSYGTSDGHAMFAFTGEAYSSQGGLAIFANSSTNFRNHGGVYFSLPEQTKGKKYTVSLWAKSIVNSGSVSLSFQAGDGRESNLTTEISTLPEWTFYSRSVFLNESKPLLFLWSNIPDHIFIIDDLKVYEELDDITFHKEPLQSFKFNFDIPRDNISYLGQKLHNDRQPKLPINVGITLTTLAQENHATTGSFLNNFALDADYSFKVKFYDKSRNLRLFYDFHNSKLDSVDYSLDIGGNKSSNLNFSMQMDVDDDTQGIFVSGNYPQLSAAFIDENGNAILDEDNNLISYDFYWKF